MFSPIDEMVALEQRKDELKRAAGYRLDVQALSALEYRPGLHQRLLARLGARMVTWGNELLARYADLSAQAAASNLATHRTTPCP